MQIKTYHTKSFSNLSMKTESLKCDNEHITWRQWIDEDSFALQIPILSLFF